MAGSSKALVVLLGAAGVAGVAALASTARAKTPAGGGGKSPQAGGGGGTTINTSAGIPTEPVKIPSTTPGVPPITIEPGNAGQLADQLVKHLHSLQYVKGGVAGARGKESKTLVKSFQKSAKLTTDGLTGPATLIAAARSGSSGVLPLVMYWPKKADGKTVAAYRTAIRAIAADAPAGVADQLRASADREQGQALGSANVRPPLTSSAGAPNS